MKICEYGYAAVKSHNKDADHVAPRALDKRLGCGLVQPMCCVFITLNQGLQ